MQKGIQIYSSMTCLSQQLDCLPLERQNQENERLSGSRKESSEVFMSLQKLCSHLQNSDVPQLPLEPVARRIWFQVVTQAQVLEPAFALVRSGSISL